MRNLKKLLAVIVAICVLATFTVPAFAADAKTDSQICTDLGVLKGAGAGVTADYLATQPDRLQGAIMFLRLKGLEDTAKAFIGTDNFSDVEGLSDTNQAILAFLKANPDLGFGGIGDNKFSPLTKMSAKEYYKVMLVALGYVYETDFTWANVFGFAASKGLVKLVDNEKFTVNDLAIGTVEALKVAVKGGTDTLIAKLVEGGSITAAAATASGLFTATPKALEVVSATADTLKYAKIVFNQELNSDTVKADNFTGPTLDTDNKPVVLLDDKKTVLVILKDAFSEQSKTADITIKNVKSAAGQTITEVKKTVTFVDNTIPVISGAVAKNAKTIVISASEPMKAINKYTTVFDKIKIDGTSVIAASSSVDFAKNTVTLNLASILTTGSHKIEIGGMTDFANYTAVTQTYSFDVAADTTAPEIASAKVNSPTEVEVTFNEDVDDNNRGSFKVNGNDVTIKEHKADNPAVFVLTIADANKLTIGATVEIAVKYKDQQDVVGNKTAEKTFTFKVADDTTLPTVTAAVGDKNKIVLTFSKAVLKTGGKVQFYKDDGTTKIGTEIELKDVTDVVKWDSSTVVNVYNVAGTTGFDATDVKDIKAKIFDVKDATVRANALAETVIGLKLVDTKKPEVKDNFKLKAGDAVADDTITIYFSEAMNADTLKNLSNYLVVTGAGIYTTPKALSAYSDVSIKEVASDSKSVVIKAKSIAAATGLGLMVQACKDTTGNMMNDKVIGSYDNTAPYVVSAKATAVNKLEIVFSQDVKTSDPSTFILYTGASSSSPVAAQIITTSIDGKKVTATLDRNLSTDVTPAFIGIIKADATKNFFDTAVTYSALGLLPSATPVAITDGVKAEVKGFTATASAIVVEFSEKMTTTAASLLANELSLAKGSDYLTTATAVAVVDKDGNGETAITDGVTASKFFMFKGLAPNTEYKIQLVPKGATKDLAGTPNVFVASEVKTITTK